MPLSIPINAYEIAERFIGLKEAAGPTSNPVVLGMLQLDAGSAIRDDETAWCSAFVNYVAWLLRLPRSKSLAARSWLSVGLPVALNEAQAGFDVVILKRGSGVQPGPEVLNAPGHVGFYARAASDLGRVYVLGGNQGDQVSVAPFNSDNVIGVRRLLRPA